MVLQPAAGARDLNPREVESNRRLCDLLAQVYRLWGYQEVSPPTIERLDALRAGGAIEEADVLRLASEDPLGLRPELTAPIVRAAGSRLADRPRPLRLWACGTTFRRVIGESGSQRIEERLQSGVELLGVSSAVADCELMHLLLAAVARLGLLPDHRPTLLVGHHALLDELLGRLPPERRRAARTALTEFDPLTLSALPLRGSDRQNLHALLALRGEPAGVLYQLEQWLGPTPLLQGLAATLESVAPAAGRLGVRLQLDPTFQPHFDLYDGLVLKLVCRGRDAPLAIASGGRYDALVGRFCNDPSLAAGTGFGFDIEAIRDLLGPQAPGGDSVGPWLVATPEGGDAVAAALERMRTLHREGQPAELCAVPCASQEEADRIAARRGCRGAIWLTP